MRPRPRRHDQSLLITSALAVALLLLLYAFTSTIPAPLLAPFHFFNAAAIALLAIVFVTAARRGAVPALTCALGAVLVHNAAVMLPYYPPADPAFPGFVLRSEDSGISSAAASVQVATRMHFALGLGMVAFGLALAYRPSLLFARNRPPDDPGLSSPWSKYPVWHGSSKLAGSGYSDPVVPAKSLMEDRDRYMMWRYEYVLATIYGAPHLVSPEGLVPSRGTAFVRDKESGLLMGKARHGM